MIAGRDTRMPAVALCAIAGWRYLQARTLELPAWVDSVHHTLLVRLILEHRGIPSTWGPYLPEVPLYYHFGFHVTAALLALLTGWTDARLGQAVLVAGQVWQVALAGAVYVLARALGRGLRAAVTAALLVGFVSAMPAYYLAWGRYTLLAGVTLMAFAMAAAAARRYVPLAFLVAATALTHYYAFVLLAVFLALDVLWARGRAVRGRLVLAAAAGTSAALPWLLHVWRWTAALQRPAAAGAGGAASPTPVLPLLGPARGYVLLALAAAGLLACILGLGRRREEGGEGRAAFATWSLLLAALLGPWHVGPFRPDHAAIVLFLPVVVFAADAAWLAGPRAGAVALALLVAWGLLETRSLVTERTLLAHPGDLEAIEWVAAHTPPQATFLVDVEPWMGVWRGADAGWWLTPLTGRRTVLPPLPYGWGRPELTSVVRATAARTYALRSAGTDGRYCAALERLMDESAAGYYYTRDERPLRCPDLGAHDFGPGRGFCYARGGWADSPSICRR